MNRHRGVKIESPCPKKWEDLSGCGSRRFCDACQLHVHDLSAMNRRELRSFLAQPGRKCGAFPVPARRASRFLRRAGLLIASLLFLPACASTRTREVTCPPPAVEDKNVLSPDDGKTMMLGGVMFGERPLWKRILWPFN